MCGIVGYIGERDCTEVLLNSLSKLEYRGYDSAGIAVFENGNITVEKLREGYKSTSTTPLGRSGKLSEVANLVCFLASERAGYIHGVTINVAGGKTRG